MKNYTCYFIEALVLLIFQLLSITQLKLISFVCDVQGRVQRSFFSLYWYQTDPVPFTEKYFPMSCHGTLTVSCKSGYSMNLGLFFGVSIPFHYSICFSSC